MNSTRMLERMGLGLLGLVASATSANAQPGGGTPVALLFHESVAAREHGFPEILVAHPQGIVRYALPHLLPNSFPSPVPPMLSLALGTARPASPGIRPGNRRSSSESSDSVDPSVPPGFLSQDFGIGTTASTCRFRLDDACIDLEAGILLHGTVKLSSQYVERWLRTRVFHLGKNGVLQAILIAHHWIDSPEFEFVIELPPGPFSSYDSLVFESRIQKLYQTSQIIAGGCWFAVTTDCAVFDDLACDRDNTPLFPPAPCESECMEGGGTSGARHASGVVALPPLPN